MNRAFVVRTEDYGQPIPGVFESLKAGKARIGWSGSDDLDLRAIRQKGGNSLTELQQEALRCHGFFDRVNIGDLLIYPNQPKRGKFCIARVTGEYEYAAKEDSIDGDFRSFRPCELLPPGPIDKSDPIVHPFVRARLGLQGRFYEPSGVDLFLDLVQRLPLAGKRPDQARDVDVKERFGRILGGIVPGVAQLIHREFPRAELSRLFCKELFEGMGHSVEITEGPSEKGADVVVTVQDELLEQEFKVGVQVASFDEDVSADTLRRKLDQLLSGWGDNLLDFGVLLTTGSCTPDARGLIVEHNKRERREQQGSRKLIKLIDAKELAHLFLKYQGQLGG